MAIDTAAKRKSAMASRCLPWQRRFTPIPDGTMAAADRRQNRWIYGGIDGTAVTFTVIARLSANITRTVPATVGVARTVAGDAEISRTVSDAAEVARSITAAAAITRTLAADTRLV